MAAGLDELFHQQILKFSAASWFLAHLQLFNPTPKLIVMNRKQTKSISTFGMELKISLLSKRHQADGNTIFRRNQSPVFIAVGYELMNSGLGPAYCQSPTQIIQFQLLVKQEHTPKKDPWNPQLSWKVFTLAVCESTMKSKTKRSFNSKWFRNLPIQEKCNQNFSFQFSVENKQEPQLHTNLKFQEHKTAHPYSYICDPTNYVNCRSI